MNPRINVGKGVTGAVNYVLGEGRDPKTGELLPDPLDGSSRVAWIGGTGFGFNIETEAHAEVARRIMEYDARWQKGQAQQDCMHLSLSWRPGEQPTREQMEEAAHDALKALGMANAKALFVAHDDEDYAHVHIVASNINPATGYRYDLAASQRKLSAWALDFEREHGGVISTRRETANELRDAITERDAGGVLEALTKQRSTFTGKILENALAKEIKGELARAQFADKILDHADIVHLSDRPGGPTTRYTTRAVLEAEQYVMRAAEGLAARSGFQIDDKQRGQIIGSEKFDAITREQARAFRHATGAEGLAIIDGQAGTGKSYTLAAIREAYEASGAKVIGLAPTNAVAQDMKGDGFGHAATLHSELFALNNGRRTWDSSNRRHRGRGGDARHQANGDVDRARERFRREIDPCRRRPPAFEHRPGRHVWRAERPLRRGRTLGSEAAAQARRAARGRDDGRGQFPRRAEHLSGQGRRSTGRARRARLAPSWWSNGRRTAPPGPTRPGLCSPTPTTT